MAFNHNKSASYTAQFMLNGEAWPEGSEVYHFTSKKAAGEALLYRIESAKMQGTAGWATEDHPAGGFARVWIGHHKDVTDLYHDWEVVIGPRGGVKFNPC